MEHKDRGFVGKHYLMKQAFGQEELHQREAVCTREDPPGCSSLQGGLRLVPGRGRDPGEGFGKSLRPVWRKRKRQPFSDPPEK